MVHEGQYVADIEVELLEMEDARSPRLSLQDAYKLDEVREALHRGDVKAAARNRKA